MRKLALLSIAAILSTGAALADPIEGTWQTIKDDNGNYGHILVKACGSKFCGNLVQSFDKSGAKISTKNDGRKIIWDMVAQGGGKYGKGKVYSPDRDKTYKSKLELNGNSLSVSGCVLGICRSGGTWKRVN